MDGYCNSAMTSRRHRIILVLGVLTILLVGLLVLRHDTSREHVIDHNLVRGYRQDRKALCRGHSLEPSTDGKKVYDLVLLSTELDWLEIRMHVLAPWVDYFVVVESTRTFTGNEKPTLLDKPEVWERLGEFKEKIVHRIVEDVIESARAWDHEDFQRNALLNAVLPGNLDPDAEPREGDVLLVSDIDEVIRPETAILLKSCETPRRLTLMSQFYYYSFQWRHVGPQWPHPQATTFGSSIEDTLRPNDLRMDILPPSLFSRPWYSLRRWWDRAILWDAGWHCSSCFSTIREFQTKMESFSHKSLNTEKNRNESVILQRVRNGIDLFGREGERYDFVERERMDLPGYVWEQWGKGRFGWLVERRGEDGGFVNFEGE